VGADARGEVVGREAAVLDERANPRDEAARAEQRRVRGREALAGLLEAEHVVRARRRVRLDLDDHARLVDLRRELRHRDGDGDARYESGGDEVLAAPEDARCAGQVLQRCLQPQTGAVREWRRVSQWDSTAVADSFSGALKSVVWAADE